MEQSDGCNSLLTTVMLCLISFSCSYTGTINWAVWSSFYHWMVIGVIMGFVFTLALEPEKIEKEDYLVLILVLWGIAVVGLSIQAVNVAATLKVFRAVHHDVPRSMSSGALLLAASNALEAMFGLAFVFIPPFLPKSVRIPKLIWISKLLISTPLAINVLYYANSKTEEMRVEEKERERVLANDFPLVYLSPGGARKYAAALVGLPVHTARTIALDSTSSDIDEDRQAQAHKSKATEEAKRHKPRGKTTFTAA